MSQETSPPPGISRRKLFLRLGILLLLAVSGFVAVRFTPLGEYLDKDKLIALFEQLRGEWWSPLLLIAGYCVSAPIGLPASPLLVSGGMVFGPWYGSLYNMIGLILGAMLSFWVARGLGREAVVHLAGDRLRKAERLFERRGFWPLVQVRFLPIPFAIVSYAAALAGVSNFRYFITSLIGLAPITLVHTYFVPKLLYSAIEGGRPLGLSITYVALLLLLNVVAGWPTLQEALRRRKRFKEIKAHRASRRSEG